MIRCYDPTEKEFNHNGLKVLKPLFAEILKVDNGDYYIDLEDLLDNLEYYQKGMIIKVATPWGVQGFRCDNPLIQNNRVTCKAWHLSYDSENYIINDASAVNKSCHDALNLYNDSTDARSPFTVYSDIPDMKTTTASKKSLYAVFVDLLNSYTGHWERDNYSFGIKSSIGQDRGVVLAYNKNITDIKVEEVWDNVCTKLLPYVKVGDEEITLDEVYIEANTDLYDIPYTKAVEFRFDEAAGIPEPTTRKEWQEWLRGQALLYLDANKIPKVNYSVSAKIDNVSDIGDRIVVRHPKCRVALDTNVISVKYDAIKGRYTAVEFGNFKKEFKSLVNEVVSTVKVDMEKNTADNTAFLQSEIASAKQEIYSVLSGGTVIISGNEILIVDHLPKEGAQYCIKINNTGVSFSKTGIYGTFKRVMAIEGTFDMQAIDIANLTASLIKGGTLKLGGTDNTNLELYDTSNNLIASMDRNGLTSYAKGDDGQYIGWQTRSIDGKLQFRSKEGTAWGEWHSLAEEGEVLFDGEANTGAILTGDVASYGSLEISYALKVEDVDYYNSVKVYDPQGKRCSLFAYSPTSYGVGAILIDGSAISFEANQTYTGTEAGGTNEIHIFKVIGYR